MLACDKIKEIEELAVLLEDLRTRGKRLVHCHGVFDLLHVGHIKHIQAARRLGDVLVVTITADRYVNKGPHLPAFTENLRAEVIAALDCVDYVAISQGPTAVRLIKLFKPHVFVKGAPLLPGACNPGGEAVDEELCAVAACGGEVAYTDGDAYSATNLINRFLDVFTPEARKFLQSFRKKYSPEDVHRHIESLSSLRILAIGDTIIDKYHFCDPLGKGSKEPVLVMQHGHVETYAGGILAVANHVSNFCDQAGVLSFVGGRDGMGDFARQALRPNVAATLPVAQGSPTLIKERFIEEYSTTKLLEVHSTAAIAPTTQERQGFLDALERLLPNYDVVIVADFGQGCLSDEAIELVCAKAPFLAVNTQANAGNYGFNAISKYSRADYVCLTEPELRLDSRDKVSPVDNLIEKLARKLSCSHVTITSGKFGSTCFSQDEGFVRAPVFSVNLVDRIGAGDALLSMTTALVARKTPLDIVAFLGNVAGAEACSIMGNKRSIEKMPFLRHVNSLLQ